MSDPLGANYSTLLTFGDNVVALTEDGTRITVWDCNVMGRYQALLNDKIGLMLFKKSFLLSSSITASRRQF